MVHETTHRWVKGRVKAGLWFTTTFAGGLLGGLGGGWFMRSFSGAVMDELGRGVLNHSIYRCDERAV